MENHLLAKFIYKSTAFSPNMGYFQDAFSITSSDPIGSFKKEIDKFLYKIPDQPTVYGLSRAAASNSIIDQVHYMNV